MTGLEDLKQIRAFVQVAESGSISAASRVLGISQPTVSRQIQALERAVNVPLIQRDTHNMSLTEAGRVLLPDARRLLVTAERARQKLLAERNTLQGHLRIVSVVDIGQWVVSRTLASFQRLHPQITAELHLINRPLKFIEEGFDCGFLVGEPLDKSLVMRRIAALPRMLAAAPPLLERYGTPTNAEDLPHLPWIGLVQPHFNLRSRFTVGAGSAAREVVVRPALLLDTVTAQREAVLAGAGFSLLPLWLAEKDLASGRLVRLLPGVEMPSIDLFAGYAAGRHITGRLRAFLDFALEEIPRLLEEK
jgi:DNA-binding transcriptional LysR family regulator